MATTLFLQSTTETGVAVAGFDELKLTTTRGASTVSGASCAATASGNHILLQSSGSVDAIWLYRVNAVTISGTVSLNVWGQESLMTTNAGFAVVVSRYDGSGTFISDVVAQANAGHADGVELGTAAALMTWTATPTSTTFAAGDWLGVVLHADAVGTMAAGGVFVDTDGPTGGVDGDTFISFTETIGAYVAAAQVPYVSPYPQILPQ